MSYINQGDKVMLRHTGEKGRVLRFLGDNQWEVHLEKMNMEIPVDEFNLVKIEIDSQTIISATKKAAQQAPAFPTPVGKGPIPQPVAPAATPVVKVDPNTLPMGPLPRKGVLNRTGFFLALVPEFGHMGMVFGYRAWLVNDTEFMFKLKCNLSNTPHEILLKSGESFSPKMLTISELEQSTDLEWQLFKIFTDNSMAALDARQLKIKHKSIVKEIETASCLVQTGHLTILQTDFSGAATESLGAYTQRKIADKPQEEFVFETTKVVPADIEAFAAFPREIDLHIEKLTDNAAALDRAAMITIQLRVFEDYLNEALALGIDQVAIIHGQGQGVLRNAIHKMLNELPKKPYLEMKYKGFLNQGVTNVTF